MCVVGSHAMQTSVSMCEHNRRKTECKDCGGSSICEHGRRRRECIDCGGSSICEHKTLRRRCKLCKGSSICEHNRRKNECRECNGTSVCAHNKLRRHCIQCGGASICVHNRRRNICKECGGSSICEHGRRKGRCKECKEVAGTVVKEEPESCLQALPSVTPPVTPLSALGSPRIIFPEPKPALASCGLSQSLLSHVLAQPSSSLPPPLRLSSGGVSSIPFASSGVPPASAPLLSPSSLRGFGSWTKDSSPPSVSTSASLLALLNASIPALPSPPSLPPLPRSCFNQNSSSAVAVSLSVSATRPLSPTTTVQVEGIPRWSRRPSLGAAPNIFDMSTNADMLQSTAMPHMTPQFPSNDASTPLQLLPK